MLSYRAQNANGVLLLTVEESGAQEGDRPGFERERLYQTIEAHPNERFAIDLGTLNYLTSGEIGFLITLKRRIDSRKGRLVLFRVDPYVLDILRGMRLHTLFEIVPTFADVLNRLDAPPVS
jgi:anti-sigma B factor antagonist